MSECKNSLVRILVPCALLLSLLVAPLLATVQSNMTCQHIPKDMPASRPPECQAATGCGSFAPGDCIDPMTKKKVTPNSTANFVQGGVDMCISFPNRQCGIEATRLTCLTYDGYEDLMCQDWLCNGTSTSIDCYDVVD
jgi:hypothetical protein